MHNVMGMTLFLDMDMVLADFDGHYYSTFGHRPDKNDPSKDVDWQAVRGTKGFYESMPPMPFMQTLWDGSNKLFDGNVFLLTGIPSSVIDAEDNKRAWAKKWLGLPPERVICTQSKSKWKWSRPGAVLVDDWEKYKLPWIANGGKWITHVSVPATLYKLEQLW